MINCNFFLVPTFFFLLKELENLLKEKGRNKATIVTGGKFWSFGEIKWIGRIMGQGRIEKFFEGG